MKTKIAKLRWFDKLTGSGYMRLLDDNVSYPFYLCNFVGANSHYPHLVSNISLEDIEKQGQLFEVLLDSDPSILSSCGLSNITILKKEA